MLMVNQKYEWSIKGKIGKAIFELEISPLKESVEKNPLLTIFFFLNLNGKLLLLPQFCYEINIS